MLKKMKQQFKRFMTGKSGFSLVELIVVIAIMAVMAAILAPALLGYVERSRAQKDDSAMGEVTNAIQLSLADQNVYDELLPYAVKGNFSCYADGDSSTNTDTNKIITKAPAYWLFNDECRKLDETPYQPAGSMRGVTITLKPNGSAEYILKDGIINQTGDSSTAKGTVTGKTLNDAPEVYNRLRSTVGDTIKVSSQTYRNSTYTIFISMGTTGGNEATAQDAIQVYGQYNGTNLPEVMTATGSASQDKGNAGSGGSEQPGGGEPSVESYGSLKLEQRYACTLDEDVITMYFHENYTISYYDGVNTIELSYSVDSENDIIILQYIDESVPCTLTDNGTKFYFDEIVFELSPVSSSLKFGQTYKLGDVTVTFFDDGSMVNSFGDGYYYLPKGTATYQENKIFINNATWTVSSDGNSITVDDGSIVTNIGTQIVMREGGFYSADLRTLYCINEHSSNAIEFSVLDSVTKIHSSAFHGVTNLVYVEIPSSVEQLPSDLFEGTTYLQRVLFAGSREQWNAIYHNNNPHFTVTCLS